MLLNAFGPRTVPAVTHLDVTAERIKRMTGISCRLGPPRIPYREAMLKYGSDKPDLRNPIRMQDVSEHFRGSGFKVFAGMIEMWMRECIRGMRWRVTWRHRRWVRWNGTPSWRRRCWPRAPA